MSKEESKVPEDAGHDLDPAIAELTSKRSPVALPITPIPARSQAS